MTELHDPATTTTVVIEDQPTRMGRTFAVALAGMTGRLVEIEADIGQSLPGFTLLGLPDQSLQEAKDRIRSAARNSGIPLTRRHLTVNLTPASLHKKGSVFDLGIVMAAYAAECRLEDETGPIFLAALGLDGSLRHAPGILPAVMAAVAEGYPEVIVADESAAEASMVPGANIRSFGHLSDVIRAFGGYLSGKVSRPAARAKRSPDQTGADSLQYTARDLADVAGQHEARFALEIAAAGGHHLLLEGVPGAGKTMLAERLPGILPVLTDQTALAATALRSVTTDGHSVAELIRIPPFQDPHHSATMASLIGGGAGTARPGAVSLAHGGVLFLDEAPEFDRRALDALRQPLEGGEVTIHRSTTTVTYPARFQLVLAANPCPCGWGSGAGKHCICTSLQRRRYTGRLSGPLLDRVDIQVTVPPVQAADMTAVGQAESSATIAARVRSAVERQHHRLREFGRERNVQISGPMLRSPTLSVSPSARQDLDKALDDGRISARGYARVLRLAWTLADLSEHDRPDRADIAMAMYLRMQRDQDKDQI